MQNHNIPTLAEKIAQIIENERIPTDLSSLQARVDRINERLDNLEGVSTIPHAGIRVPLSTHPSQEKFAVIEAFADEIFANLQKEKACTFEPNGKPCDHCSMCSSRGF
ncbi:MAG: hypothetical protein H7070_12630 [Saprospiraceae bacterium]|nr:hypothetical protein [Pyrinomonadaceae bacterium]